jgi:hypothetical protein
MGAGMVFVVARDQRLLRGWHKVDCEKESRRRTAEQVEGRLKNPNGMAAAHALIRQVVSERKTSALFSWLLSGRESDSVAVVTAAGVSTVEQVVTGSERVDSGRGVRDR